MPSQLPGVFIVGTDTAVGKTYQACRLARLLRTRTAWRIGVYKPAQSGAAENGQSDAELLQAAAGCHESLERVCPQQFVAALAPPIAAEVEGRHIDDALLMRGALWWQARCDYLIVEGAGGLLSPLSDRITVLDLAQQLALPLLIVAANRLGAVNHTLLTLSSARSAGLTVAGIILNELPADESLPNAQIVEHETLRVLRRTNADLIRRFADSNVPVVRSIEEYWKYAQSTVVDQDPSQTS